MSGEAIQWWLVRHAPTVNPENAVYGALDFDIHMPAPETFQALSDVLPDDPVWMISHLSRTRKTLDGILAARDAHDADFHVEERFGEQNFGDWEGPESVIEDLRASLSTMPHVRAVGFRKAKVVCYV